MSRPKCLVELAGVPILERQVDVLKAVGVTDIQVVGGYQVECLLERGYDVVLNEEYAVSNMVASLFAARPTLLKNEDLLIAYGDIVYEPKVIEALMHCDEPLAVTIDIEWKRYWEIRMEDPLQDAETLKVNEEGFLVELGKKPGSYDEIQGQYMGLIKIRADYLETVVRMYDDMNPLKTYDGKDFKNMYMTSFLQHLIDQGLPVKAVAVKNGWLEVDSVSDLDTYHRLHREGRLAHLCRLA